MTSEPRWDIELTKSFVTSVFKFSQQTNIVLQDFYKVYSPIPFSLHPISALLGLNLDFEMAKCSNLFQFQTKLLYFGQCGIVPYLAEI